MFKSLLFRGVFLLSFALGQKSTFLAGGASTVADLDGKGDKASFKSYPSNMMVDSGQNIYIFGSPDKSYRKVTPSGDVTTTVYSTSSDSYSYAFVQNIVNGYIYQFKCSSSPNSNTGGASYSCASSSINGGPTSTSLFTKLSSTKVYILYFAFDIEGNLYLYQYGAISRITVNGNLSVVAGSGSFANDPDIKDGVGTSATLSYYASALHYSVTEKGLYVIDGSSYSNSRFVTIDSNGVGTVKTVGRITLPHGYDISGNVYSGSQVYNPTTKVTGSIISCSCKFAVEYLSGQLYYFSNNNLFKHDPCGAGFKGNGGGESTLACFACPAGSFQTSPSAYASACTECPTGQYAPKESSSSCMTVPKGQAAAKGRIYYCSPGQYSDEGGGICKNCPAGQSSSYGSSSCQNCLTGFTSYAGGVCVPEGSF